jgi:electron transfer flavoprotein alpha subunit
MQNLQKENSKVAFELASYAKKSSRILRDNCNNVNADDVSEFMENKVLKVKKNKLAAFTAKAYADVITSGTKRKRKVILLSSTTDSIYLSSLVAVALEAGFASNVVGLPLSISQQEKKCLLNKAFNTTEINTEVKVPSLH